jgi:multidrug efflux system membrane fusion protein
VHEGRIYVLNEENRLEIRPVRLKYTLGDYAVVDRGVEQGERILVSDLIPAVEGMLIEPQEDKKSRKKLVAAVTGKEPEK